MIETTEWAEWRHAWQTPKPASPELDAAIARFHRAKRRDSILRVVELAFVVSTALFPLLAIRHAANSVEATLGIGAVLIVLGVAAFRGWHRRAERTALATSAREFDDAVRALRTTELRFVRFLWLVLAVECAFAVVWWYGGLEVHDYALSPLALGMLWLPLSVVAVTLGWSIRLRADARRELALLTRPDSAGPDLDA